MYTEARKLNVQSAIWAFAIHYDFCPRVAKQGEKKNKIKSLNNTEAADGLRKSLGYRLLETENTLRELSRIHLQGFCQRQNRETVRSLTKLSYPYIPIF